MPRRSARRKTSTATAKKNDDVAKIEADDETEVSNHLDLGENQMDDNHELSNDQNDENHQNGPEQNVSLDTGTSIKSDSLSDVDNGLDEKTQDSEDMDKSNTSTDHNNINTNELPSKETEAIKQDEVSSEEFMDTLDAVDGDNSDSEPISPNKMKDVIELDVAEDSEGINDGSEDGNIKNKETENDEVKKEQVDDGLERMPIPPPDYAASYDDDCEVPLDPELDEGENPAMPSEEFTKYWSNVQQNPQDFTAWTYLLQLVEQENVASLARRAYNEFFKRYPLCYGYWKKFSEFERRSNHMLRAQRVLERGVRAIPLSVDLWVHVIDFYNKHYKGTDAGIDYTRRVLDRAIEKCGKEFRSEKLWNKYLRWEVENKAWKNVMAIYDKVLKTETQHYSVFYSDLKDFINAHHPTEIVSYQDYEAKLEKVRADTKAKNEEKKEKPPVDEMAPPGVEDGDSSKPPTEKELKGIRQLIIAEKKQIYEKTEQQIAKIWSYEEGIKRPYFHVKALERTQIKNWRDYLDAEIARGEENHSRVILLFERCLIACALYEDFWMKYSKYMAKTDIPAARAIYRRACDIHLPKKSTIHLHWATFEEANGNPEAAMEVLNKLDNNVPGLAMIRLRKVSIMRRAKDFEKAEELLKTYIAGSTGDSDTIFYSRKLAWFLTKILKKTDEARDIYKKLLEKYKNKAVLYKDMLEFEFFYGNDESVLDICEKACTNSNLTDEDKFYFSQRRLTHLEDFACDPKRLQKAYDDHQKWTRIQRKRSQNDIVVVEPSSKKSKGDGDASSGSRISTTNNRYSSGSSNISVSATTYTNTATANPVAANTVYGQPTQYSSTATNDPATYYQNYWNYQQKPADQTTQQYNYNQWAQYNQQYYQQP